MERPKLRVKEVSIGGKTLYDVELQISGPPEPIVAEEFMEVAGRHCLSPDGGCYLVTALTLDRHPVSFLHGMHVPPHKYGAVLADLQSRGYTIMN